MLFIGDSSLDAQAAQVPFVAYANSDLRAHAHIDSLQQVETLLGLMPVPGFRLTKFLPPASLPNSIVGAAIINS